MSESPEDLLYLFALQNAVRHRTAPKAGAVVGALLGAHPDLRTLAKEIAKAAPPVVARVDAMSHEEREEELFRRAPDLAAAPEKKKRTGDLPPLQGADSGVVMRFAPNPSGPLHLGHARAAVLNDWYVRHQGGRFVLRIEDTDPRRVDPEAYAMVLEDSEWLGLGITEIVYQSDRLQVYYDHCRRLLELGGAYVCTCDAERFRELKIAKRPCPHRGREVEENLALWERMLAGEFYQGQVTVRIKTDISHPDPAMRDFSAFRVVSEPAHPRADAAVYPLMNFSVAIDDHLLGMTHVIRGKDHIANTRRQAYIFDYFGWEPPRYLHYGRMSISGLVLSTSGMREGIASGRYSGWDDIRLGTLRAIARRGISRDAVRAAMVDIGVGDTDITFSWENLYAANKAIVDDVANRYFFVPDPVAVTIAGAPGQTAHASLHPSHPDRGTRDLACTGTVLLPGAEIGGHDLVRLKDLFNVRIDRSGEDLSVSYAGDSLEEARAAKAPIIQWLPEDYATRCLLRHPDGNLSGYCEPAVAGEVDRVVQFERVGFARVDAVDEEKQRIVAYFAHR